MTLWLIVALGAMTYLSRALGLAFIPRPSQRAAEVLERVVAPLFAGFAAISLVTATRAAAPPERSQRSSPHSSPSELARC